MNNIKNLNDLLQLDLPDVEFEEDSEIEFEISKYISLIYSIKEKIYYAYEYNIEDEDEYRIPITINDDNDLPFGITIQDKKDFYKLIEDLKSKGEING